MIDVYSYFEFTAEYYKAGGGGGRGCFLMLSYSDLTEHLQNLINALVSRRNNRALTKALNISEYP